jgi:hypothetical protein
MGVWGYLPEDCDNVYDYLDDYEERSGESLEERDERFHHQLEKDFEEVMRDHGECYSFAGLVRLLHYERRVVIREEAWEMAAITIARTIRESRDWKDMNKFRNISAAVFEELCENTSVFRVTNAKITLSLKRVVSKFKFSSPRGEETILI